MSFFVRKPAERAAPRTAPADRIYAIGDVHGRLDLLDELIGRIDAHSAGLATGAAATHIVMLGDLIDRGPDSAGVIARLRTLQRERDGFIVLAGNHEDLLVRAHDGEWSALRTWAQIGGLGTLRSYGADPAIGEADQARLLEELRRVVSRDEIGWLRSLAMTAQSGDYFCCHAGVRPGVALARQTRHDLLWVREEFLADPRDHGAVIVHGHTISPAVEILPNRIGVDTGAYRSGVLSAIYLEGSDRAVIATGAAATMREPSAAAAR